MCVPSAGRRSNLLAMQLPRLTVLRMHIAMHNVAAAAGHGWGGAFHLYQSTYFCLNRFLSV